MQIDENLKKSQALLNQYRESLGRSRLLLQKHYFPRAVELAPDSGHDHYLLGLSLARIGQEEDAIATFRRAGELLEQQGKIELAVESYQEMLKLASNGDISFKLGMLHAQCGQFSEALTQYQQALQSQSRNPENYAKLAVILVKQGLEEEVFNCHQECYQKLETNDELIRAYHQFGLLLYQEGLVGEAVKCFQAPGVKSSGKWKIYQDIWDDLNQKDISTVGDWSYPTEIPLEGVAECFSNNSNYRVMTLDSLSESDKIYLEKNGLYLLYLELLRHQNFSLEQILIKSFDESHEILNNKLNITGYKFANYHYEQSLVETGYIYAFCPLSGKILRSNQSFVINHRDLDGKQRFDLQGFCYRFVGEEVFYVMTGHIFGYILLVYFPKMELIINLNAYHLTDSSYRPVENMNKLKSYMVTCWQDVKSYIASPSPKQVVDVIGLQFNMGHHFWQDLTGIHVLHKNDLLHKLDKVLVGPGDYFSAKDVFPEIPPEKFVEVEDVWQVFQNVVAHNCVALRVNGYFIEEDLAHRVFSGGIKQSSESFLQEVEKAKQHFPLILIWIRSHFRVWLSQVEGFANIINHLAAEFPNLGIIFDGWGSKRTYDESTAIEIKRVNETIENILPLITQDIYIYNSNGSMNYEKAVWSKAIDCYIAAAGSGLTFPIWIGGKPGVVYGTNYDRETFTRCEFSAAVRENAVDAIPLLPDMFDSNGWISEYDMDWQIIYDEIVQIIREISP
jgi:tetratricopeptide (TPR) repeat protein